MATGRFAELLTNLANEHTAAVNSVRDQYERKLAVLTSQIAKLNGGAEFPFDFVDGAGAEKTLDSDVSAPQVQFTLQPQSCGDGVPQVDGFVQPDSTVVKENVPGQRKKITASLNGMDAPHSEAKDSSSNGRRMVNGSIACSVQSMEAPPATRQSATGQHSSCAYLIRNCAGVRAPPPGHFRMKPMWDKGMGDWSTNLEISMPPKRLSVHSHAPANSFPQVPRPRFPRSLSSLVISPNGLFRMTWDVAGMILIGYDCLMIPFTQAYEPKQSTFLSVMDAFLLYFWTLDMLQAFNLGFYSKGQYVTSHCRILINYLKTWFFIDLIVVGPEWMSIVAGSGDVLGGLGRMLKGARAIRVLRLLRLLKLQRIINMLYDLLESEYTFIVVNLVKLLLSVSVLNHVIACVWYWIGRKCMEADMRNWIDVGDVKGEELPYRYTTSLHWSLTQFTPASMDISARNVYERIFSIIVLFFAMVAFSSIVASITGAMTSLRNLKSDQNKQFWLLRRYLRQRNITSSLSSRIVKFLEYQLEEQSTIVQLSSIKIIGGLSEELQRELAHQMHSSYLMSHPFFMHLETCMEIMMQRLCFSALKLQSYAENEVVFNIGDEALCMYFIKNGSQVYLYAGGHELDPPPVVKEWVSEPILFADWRHKGRLSAVSASDLILVNPAKFVHVMSLHPRPWSYAKLYGFRFLEVLNSMEVSGLLDFIRNDCFDEEKIKIIAAEAGGGAVEAEDELTSPVPASK